MYPQGFDENYPITVSSDPISGHQSMLMPNGYDPITDAFSTLYLVVMRQTEYSLVITMAIVKNKQR